MSTPSAPRRRVRTRPATVSVELRRHSGLRVSPHAFARICADNPDLRLERAATGELIVMAPAGMESGGRNASLTAQIWTWNSRTKLGRVFDSSAGFTLPNGVVRAADTAWVARDRWERLTAVERDSFADIVPDFVAELRSKSDRISELRQTLLGYLDQGVRLAWLIDPYTSTCEIYRPGRPVEVLDRPATLSGEDVLPGLVLDLRGILFD